MAVAAQPHKQRVAVTQRDPAGERVNLHPCLEGVLDCLGDWDLPFAAAFAVNVEAVMAAVRARAAEILGAQAPQLS